MTSVAKAVTHAVTSREVLHNFSAVVARVARGEELTVTRYGKPVLRLVQVAQPAMTAEERQAWIEKVLAIRLDKPLVEPGQKFNRNAAYDD
jgi:prevent-host-death family protein